MDTSTKTNTDDSAEQPIITANSISQNNTKKNESSKDDWISTTVKLHPYYSTTAKLISDLFPWFLLFLLLKALKPHLPRIIERLLKFSAGGVTFEFGNDQLEEEKLNEAAQEVFNETSQKAQDIFIKNLNDLENEKARESIRQVADLRAKAQLFEKFATTKLKEIGEVSKEAHPNATIKIKDYPLKQIDLIDRTTDKIKLYEINWFGKSGSFITQRLKELKTRIESTADLIKQIENKPIETYIVVPDDLDNIPDLAPTKVIKLKFEV